MGCGASRSAHRGDSNIDDSAPSRVSRKLVPVQSWNMKKAQTIQEINEMREEFWHTRIEGQREAWDALRAACDAMCGEDLGLANAILEAANIITPGGSLDLSYDERGNQYRIPVHCYSYPANVVRGGVGGASSTAVGVSSHTSGVVGVAPSLILTPLRLRISHGEFDITVDVNLAASVSDVKRRLDLALRDVVGNNLISTDSRHRVYASGLPPERQRLFFRGKELISPKNLSEYNVSGGVIVQVYVRPVARSSA